jgi:small-conductance mechanosensitive channel
VALSHYAREARNHWKKAEKKLAAAEKSYAQERKARRQAQADLVQLKDRVQVLEKADLQLKNWEARKPMIEHYLGRTEAMAKSVNPSQLEGIDD